MENQPFNAPGFCVLLQIRGPSRGFMTKWLPCHINSSPIDYFSFRSYLGQRWLCKKSGLVLADRVKFGLCFFCTRSRAWTAPNNRLEGTSSTEFISVIFILLLFSLQYIFQWCQDFLRLHLGRSSRNGLCLHWWGSDRFMHMSWAVYWSHEIRNHLKYPGCVKYNPWPAKAICLPCLLREAHLKFHTWEELLGKNISCKRIHSLDLHCNLD